MYLICTCTPVVWPQQTPPNVGDGPDPCSAREANAVLAGSVLGPCSSWVNLGHLMLVPRIGRAPGPASSSLGPPCTLQLSGVPSPCSRSLTYKNYCVCLSLSAVSHFHTPGLPLGQSRGRKPERKIMRMDGGAD